LEQLIEVHQSLPFLMRMRGNDQEFAAFVSLLTKIPEIQPRIPEVLSTMLDIFSEAIKDMGPNDEPFEIFLAYTSVILEKSQKQDYPDDEYLITVIGRNDLNTVVDRMAEHTVKHTLAGQISRGRYLYDIQLFSKLKEAVNGDL